MRLSDLFVGEHADYYAERTFGPMGFSTMLGSPAELIELLGNLYRRVDVLEARVQRLEAKLDKILDQSARRTPLDEIKGLGQERKLNLLRRFGSVERIREASIEELCEVSGIGLILAQRIKQKLS